MGNHGGITMGNHGGITMGNHGGIAPTMGNHGGIAPTMGNHGGPSIRLKFYHSQAFLFDVFGCVCIAMPHNARIMPC